MTRAKTDMVQWRLRLRLRLRRTVRTVGILLPLLLMGCGTSKVGQCNQLAEVVNQTQGFMQEFETEIQIFSESAAEVRDLDDIRLAASQYTTAVDKVVINLNGLVGDLQSTTLQDETLSQFRDSYVGVVQGFSAALTDAREAMDLVVQVESEAELPARIEESQQQTLAAVSSIETLSQQESQLINEVNSYCGAAQPPAAQPPAAQPTAPTTQP